MTSVSWASVLGHRLERHALLEAAPADGLVGIVGRLCGIHAQVTSSTDLSIGTRVEGAEQASVHRALWDERTLVKTYGLRGTLHVFPSHELGLWLTALRAMPWIRGQDRLETTGTSQAQLGRMVDVLVKALDGVTLTRDELGAAVVARIGPSAADKVLPAFGDAWPRWHLALSEAARLGLVCFAPSLGNRVRLARVDQWLGPLDPHDPGEASRELVRRFIGAYGPSTPGELAQWANGTRTWAQALMRTLGDELAEVDVEGSRRWALATDAPGSWAPADGSVHLLGAFDIYAVGGFPRDVLVPPTASERILASPLRPARIRSGREALSGPLPVLLVDGAVGGTWQRTRHGRRLEVKVDPFSDLASEQMRALEYQAQRIGTILGFESELSVGPIEPRFHL